MNDKLTEQRFRDSAFPSSGAVDISGGDKTLDYPTTLLVTQAGDVNVVYDDDTEEVISDLPSGYYLPVKVKTVKQTSTTATVRYIKLK